MAAKFTQQDAPSPQKLYDDALEYKNDGNELYKNKEMRKAMRKYHYALLYLRDINQEKDAMIESMYSSGKTSHPKPSPELKHAASRLQRDCYNNLAACLLHQDDPNYEKIQTYCDNVLDLEPKNCKALYRRGIALFNLKKYDRALDSFSLAQHYSEKSDPSVSKYIALCREKTKGQDAELKQTYKNMMSNIMPNSNTSCNT